MKQALSILLALALLAVCFTACSESPAETKTDAIENKIVSSNPASLSVSTSSQQKQETTSTPSMQPDDAVSDSDPVVSNNSQETMQEQNDYQTDAISQLPVFTSVQQMEAFFKNGIAKNDVEA